MFDVECWLLIVFLRFNNPQSRGLSSSLVGVSSGWVKEKYGLPLILIIVFALTRLPGVMPWNFSAAYALAFCAGVYFPRRMAWWLPLGTLLATDILINLYYQFYLHIDAFKPSLLVHLSMNYLSYAVLIALGEKIGAKASWLKLVSGGILGAILFYLITNTASWLFNPFHNPEYTKNLTGWIVALTKGTAGYPQTWEFFRNTLLSGGIFTALFAGAMKLTASESAKEKEPIEEEAEQPEEAKA